MIGWQEWVSATGCASCGATEGQGCDLNCDAYRDAFLGPDNLRPIE